MPDFVHLHVHSDYSLLDGAAPVDGLVRATTERDMGAIALTDHGNLFGALAFYGAARKGAVKPIVGCEMYMAPGRRTDRQKDPATGLSAYHLTVLAKDHEGYRNLVRLSSAAFMDGFYYAPRIDRELFEKHHKGLIVLSGCLKGEPSHSLRTGNRKRAVDAASFYKSLLGDDFFMEVMRNGAEGQEENNRALVALARELRIPLVATNDVHYLSADDFLAHEARVCISTGKTLESEDRLRAAANEFWLKSPRDMEALFADLPEAVRNTALIADRCSLALEFQGHRLPRFTPPGGEDAVPFFRRLCRDGLEKRYPGRPADATARLEREMGVIEKMGYVSYFLIVWDFIRFAKEHGIPVGPGRGSAAGSIVAYSLGITDVDPLKYGLLFERFLNSERVSMPDIDIDFCRDGREQVIRYVNGRYGGPENVSQIITFGTMAARAVLRDVGRVLAVPLAEVDQIAKKVPAGPGVTLKDALGQDAELAAFRADPRYQKLFDIALRLEGMNRHASVHAAGVVIGDGPLAEHVPLYKDPQGESVTTQWTMEELEKVGLLKMDFLGLKTLTVLAKAVALLERSLGKRLDLRSLPEGDPATYAMLGRGESAGVFQLESGGMRDILQRMKPDRFEDLVAILALYRPGPLQSGMVDAFIDRKHGRAAVEYPHPSLREVLEETYGTFVYQEQVMQIANVLAGFTMNQADELRKAMSKKDPERMAKLRDRFLEGAGARGCPAEQALRIWTQMESFAAYCFNKSHTAAYAVLTYQTAYLKANHPVEFQSAFLSCDMGVTEKLVEGIEECRRAGIRLLPPCVHRSGLEFAPEGGAIRFGLAGIKGVGERAVAEILAARKRLGGRFPSLLDLCEGVDLHLVNRQALEALVKSGALDDFLGPEGTPGRGAQRGRLLEALDHALRAAGEAQADRKAGQMSLFGGGAPGSTAGGVAATAAAPAPRELPAAPAWPENQVLAFEKETLGFYVTSHPLAGQDRTLRAFATHGISELAGVTAGARVRVGGMISALQARFPKQGPNKNRKYARFRMEDLGGSVDCVCFSDAYDRLKALLANDRIVFAEGSVASDRDEPSLRVDVVIPVEEAFAKLASGVVIDAGAPGPAAEASFQALRRVLGAHPGALPVILALEPEPGVEALYRLEGVRVSAGNGFVEAVEKVLGRGCLRFGRTQVSAPPRRGGWSGSPGG